MKTVKKGDQIVRKSNEEAEEMVKKGWTYCKKSEWKKIRNTISQEKVEVVENIIEEKPVKKKTKWDKKKQEKKYKNDKKAVDVDSDVEKT